MSLVATPGRCLMRTIRALRTQNAAASLPFSRQLIDRSRCQAAAQLMWCSCARRLMSTSDSTQVGSEPSSETAPESNAYPRISSRNKKLASVIREGIALLNQSATAIQNDPHTRKNIFMPDDQEQGPDPRQLSEGHRIFQVAQDCLDDMCMKDSTFELMAANEPIMLIGVEVNKAYTFADIYWAMPYPVLSTPELNDKQRAFLLSKMDERVQGAAGRQLIARINAVLKFYYPPKIRFKVAPPALVQAVIQEIEEE